MRPSAVNALIDFLTVLEEKSHDHWLHLAAISNVLSRNPQTNAELLAEVARLADEPAAVSEREAWQSTLEGLRQALLQDRA